VIRKEGIRLASPLFKKKNGKREGGEKRAEKFRGEQASTTLVETRKARILERKKDGFLIFFLRAICRRGRVRKKAALREEEWSRRSYNKEGSRHEGSQ